MFFSIHIDYRWLQFANVSYLAMRRNKCRFNFFAEEL
jgi:hypothetical protein